MTPRAFYLRTGERVELDDVDGFMTIPGEQHYVPKIREWWDARERRNQQPVDWLTEGF
jgi:hypothetical protein